MKYYVLNVDADGLTAWALFLDPVSMDSARQAIAWQRIGQGELDDWRICTIQNGRMVDQNGNALAVRQGVYTDAAFARLASRLQGGAQ